MTLQLVSEASALYIGGITKDVTNDILIKHLEAINCPTTYVKLISAIKDSKHPTFAVALYFSEEDATNAILRINKSELCGTALRAFWYCPNISAANKEANLYVSNIAPSISQATLYTDFSKYGEIVSCKLIQPEKAFPTNNYAFVQFSLQTNAEKALAEMNKKVLDGVEIKVEKYKTKEERVIEKIENPESNNLYISGLPVGKCSEDTIKEFFAPYGKIRSVYVPKYESGEIKGFAYVCYETKEEANLAIAKLKDAEIVKGYKLNIQIYLDKKDRDCYKKMVINQKKSSQSSVCVKGLKGELIEKDLESEFSKFGKVVRVKILGASIYSADGSCKILCNGMAFVELNSKDEADKAVEALNNKMIFNSKVTCSIAAPSKQIAKMLKREEYRQSALNDFMIKCANYMEKNNTLFQSYISQTKYDKEKFTKMEGEEKVQFAGSLLFNRALAKYQNEALAAKLTGMIMEIKMEEIEIMLDTNTIDEKLEEANKLLSISS
jgi:polyadenylate-binding protein